MDKGTLLAIALVLVVLVLGLTHTGTIFSSGFAPLYLGQGTSYDGTNYTLLIASDGSGNSAKGTFSPSDVAAFTGQAPGQSFNLTEDMTSQLCTYTLKNNSNPIYTYSTYVVGLTAGDTCSGTCRCPTRYSDIGPHVIQSGIYGSYDTTTCLLQTKVGEEYDIDTVAHYNFLLNISIQAAGGSQSLLLSQAQQEASIPNLLKANLIGSLMGAQSCPTPSADTVIFRPVNTNQLIAKNKADFTSIYGVAQPTSAAGAVNQAAQVTHFINTQATPSAYCSLTSTDPLTAQYSCTPASAVAIPLVRLQVKASYLGINTPNGQPKILSYTTTTASAGNTTTFNVVVQNTAQEGDSFDVSISGPNQVSLQSTRVNIQPAAQASVPVLLQGSGIIGQYTIKATSVNNPNNSDSVTFTLKIVPFCDKAALAGHEKVSTEYGCEWLCPNTYQTDIREATCQQFGTFESNGSYSTEFQYYQGENKCVGIGQFATLYNYMQSVRSGVQQPFVPVPQANAYFLPAPICNYVGVYGYHWTGLTAVPLSSSIFDYSINPSMGQLVALDVANQNITPPPPQNTSIPLTPPQNNQTTQITPGSGSQTPQNIALALIPAILIVGGAIYLLRRNKRL